MVKILLVWVYYVHSLDKGTQRSNMKTQTWFCVVLLVWIQKSDSTPTLWLVWLSCQWNLEQNLTWVVSLMFHAQWQRPRIHPSKPIFYKDRSLPLRSMNDKLQLFCKKETEPTEILSWRTRARRQIALVSFLYK